jgi:hypothetical protein
MPVMKWEHKHRCQHQSTGVTGVKLTVCRQTANGVKQTRTQARDQASQASPLSTPHLQELPGQ